MAPQETPLVVNVVYYGIWAFVFSALGMLGIVVYWLCSEDKELKERREQENASRATKGFWSEEIKEPDAPPIVRRPQRRRRADIPTLVEVDEYDRPLRRVRKQEPVSPLIAMLLYGKDGEEAVAAFYLFIIAMFAIGSVIGAAAKIYEMPPTEQKVMLGVVAFATLTIAYMIRKYRRGEWFNE